jgi:hypothetical protein
MARFSPSRGLSGNPAGLQLVWFPGLGFDVVGQFLDETGGQRIGDVANPLSTSGSAFIAVHALLGRMLISSL